MYGMSAAHRTLPLPSFLRVRNPANGKEVVVRVNDRGPFHSQRILDLSYAAAFKLDLLRGVGAVEIERITPEDIRTGAWSPAAGRGTGSVALAGAPAPRAEVPAPALPPAASAPAREAEPASAAAATTTAAKPAGFWLQLAAFRQGAGAQGFRQQVLGKADWLAGALAVTTDDKGMQRVQAGPYPSRAEAQTVASRLREVLSLVPLVVERR